MSTELPVSESAELPVSESAPSSFTPPSILERLLSPRGIHALLGSGGGLFVIGLVTWLATLGIFDHPLVLASALGGANLALLVAGFWLVLSTRFQLAGLALTLLACLLMPLHLWFYHAQKLLTFDNHLWAAALVISLLYALTARILRNVWFVPIFLGGIALTVLLILADVGQFWQITAPAISLCLLGILAIHCERLFTLDPASPYRRERFGLAFFWSGHALLGLGLLMVLIAQLAGGPLYETHTRSLYQQWNVTRTELVTTQTGKLTALFLVLAGIYAHLYSDLIVRRKGYYLQIAAVLMLWVEFIIIDLLHISLEKESLLGVIAATGLLLHLVHRYLGNRLPAGLPLLPLLASLLIVGSTALGLLFYVVDSLRYLHTDIPVLMQFDSKQALLLSMVVAGLAQLVGYFTSKEERYIKLYRGAVSLTALLILALVISNYAAATWFTQAGCILAMAIAAVVLAWKVPVVRDLGQYAHLFVTQWLVLGFPQFVQLGGDHAWYNSAILLSATGFYLLTTLLLRQHASIPIAIVTALLGLVHLFAWFDFALSYKLTACAGLGAIITILGTMVTRREGAGQPLGTFLTKGGQTLFFVAVLGSMLLGVQTMVASQQHQQVWPMTNSLLLEAGLCWLFYLFMKNNSARQLYLAFAIANVGLAGLLFVTQMNLPMWRKMEFASIGLGLGLTILGFRAWIQEANEQHRQASVSPLFLLGSLLIGVPIALVVMNFRSSGQFMVMDEAAMLILGLLLLVAGCICQVRIPALAGATLTLLYLAGLLIFVPWGHLGTASLILAGCGGTVFLLGLALSIFRDQLLALPTRVKERRGIFQVLGWR